MTNLDKQYFNRALHLFFCNVVNASDKEEGEVTEDEALEILLTMDVDSNNYGELEPMELYQDCVSGYLLDLITDTANWFKTFHVNK